MTQRQRGRLLVVVFVAALVTFQTMNWWANRRANDRAAEVAAQLRQVLPTVNLLQLRTTGTDRGLETLSVRSVSRRAIAFA